MRMQSADGAVSVHFSSPSEASAFFESGSIGYSARRGDDKLDGIALRTRTWSVQPLAIESVASSYFDDESLFPRGSATFDCALIMRNIAHEWESLTSRQPLSPPRLARG